MRANTLFIALAGATVAAVLLALVRPLCVLLVALAEITGRL